MSDKRYINERGSTPRDVWVCWVLDDPTHNDTLVTLTTYRHTHAHTHTEGHRHINTHTHGHSPQTNFFIPIA